MQLDWVIQDKVVDGRTVTPAETAGQRILDPKDPESIALLEEHREEMRKRWPLPGPMPAIAPGPGGLWSVFDVVLLGGPLRRRRDHEKKLAAWRSDKVDAARYHLPLEQVLPSFVAEDPPYVVQEAAPDRQDALAEYTGCGSAYSLDAWYLHDDYNAVAAHAAFELKLQSEAAVQQRTWPRSIASGNAGLGQRHVLVSGALLEERVR